MSQSQPITAPMLGFVTVEETQAYIDRYLEFVELARTVAKNRRQVRERSLSKEEWAMNEELKKACQTVLGEEEYAAMTKVGFSPPRILNACAVALFMNGSVQSDVACTIRKEMERIGY